MRTWKRWRPIIQKEMAAQGITVVDMCRKTGLAWQTITNWMERGNGQTPGFKSLEKVLDVLGLEMCLRRRKKGGAPSQD